MKILFILISLTFAMTSHAESTRFFSTTYGDIDLVALEQNISELIEADVQDLTMRRTYDPADRLVLNSLSNYRAFVISFSLNKKYKVVCDFVIIKNRNTAMITDCDPDYLRVRPPGFIKITDIGLDPITESKP